MQHRPLAAAAAAVVVALAATGCNILTPQATTIQYDPSDGISGSTGTVEFHNALLVGEPEGDALNLAVTFTNPGEATTVEVRVDDQAQQVRVPQGTTVFGFPDEEQLVFEVDEVEFGAQRNVSFQADGAEPEGVGVQVFSTEFPDYAELGPAE
ncbi:hypothetical protein [Agrococcus sp. HG114]|uniref:hypothetical protein n=1 Tax=Agrococcus sp. HG114 TaxID=2969757 RepID=UPI00215A4ECB|nr:hypothetical protein [Agrococcus sp. HG114]MCR8671502.1 hypothetical protein [Agrococcus sp. HG114]